MGNRKEGDQHQQQEQRRRTTVPAFGEWDEMKAAGVLPDYSLDFSKIRAVRMQQRKEGPLTWSAAAGDAAAGEVDAGETAGRRSSTSDRDHRPHHRRRHSDGSDLRRPLRSDRAAPKERSKLIYLFCCIAG